jgi:hypothetical protein
MSLAYVEIDKSLENQNSHVTDIPLDNWFTQKISIWLWKISNVLYKYAVSFFMLSIYLLCMAIILWFFCYNNTKHFHGMKPNRGFKMDMFDRMYYSLITIVTVGYGDIAPKSTRAKLVTSFIILNTFVMILNTFDNLIKQTNKYFTEVIDVTSDISKKTSDAVGLT